MPSAPRTSDDQIVSEAVRAGHGDDPRDRKYGAMVDAREPEVAEQKGPGLHQERQAREEAALLERRFVAVPPPLRKQPGARAVNERAEVGVMSK